MKYIVVLLHISLIPELLGISGWVYKTLMQEYFLHLRWILYMLYRVEYMHIGGFRDLHIGLFLGENLCAKLIEPVYPF